MDKNNNIYVKTGFVISAFCVFMGAFASHILKEIIEPADIVTFDTGTKYMFYHAMAISFISLSHRKFHQNILDLAIFLYLGGILFFTGSLYLMATRNIWGDESYIWLGALTPIGGVLFISAWLILISKGFIKAGDEKSTGLIEKKKHRHRKSRTKSSATETNVAE
ncbi:MAG: DUF423 domain-containing protein [Bacteroidia bacterium]|jgi:uncharacterized membrane protein YgdD (TMEM256/DUF423 family)|nr:DUF423 domain-containing protein [Bacteroidia bacterium]